MYTTTNGLLRRKTVFDAAHSVCSCTRRASYDWRGRANASRARCGRPPESAPFWLLLRTEGLALTLPRLYNQDVTQRLSLSALSRRALIMDAYVINDNCRATPISDSLTISIASSQRVSNLRTLIPSPTAFSRPHTPSFSPPLRPVSRHVSSHAS